jgi:hypothetical protein
VEVLNGHHQLLEDPPAGMSSRCGSTHAHILAGRGAELMFDALTARCSQRTAESIQKHCSSCDGWMQVSAAMCAVVKGSWEYHGSYQQLCQSRCQVSTSNFPCHAITNNPLVPCKP